jgi:hypothetical protein
VICVGPAPPTADAVPGSLGGEGVAAGTAEADAPGPNAANTAAVEEWAVAGACATGAGLCVVDPPDDTEPDDKRLVAAGGGDGDAPLIRPMLMPSPTLPNGDGD